MKFISKSPNYLIRNQYSYCFRMKIPQDLQKIIRIKELRYSLKTGYVSEAKEKARGMAAKVQYLFKYLREESETVKKVDSKLVQKMAIQYLNELKAMYDEPSPSSEVLNKQGIIPPDDTESFIAEIEYFKDECLSKLNACEYDEVMEKADQLLKDNGVKEIDKESNQYWELCRGLMRAQIQGYKYQIETVKGNFSDDLQKAFESMADQTELVKVNESASKDTKTGELFSEIVDKYVSEREEQWSDRTQEEYVQSYKLFIEVMRDIPIKSITRREMSSFKDIIRKLPPNRKKVKAYRDKSIDELVKMDLPSDKTLSVQTVNKNITRVGSVMLYAYLNGYHPGPTPTEKMLIPDKRKKNELREHFNKDDLIKLFRSKDYLENKFSREYMFWLPIIALFQGMRQNEIAQLYLDDIKKTEDGIWYFDIIADTDDKRVKDNKIRHVPIHPFLIDELNFLKLIEHLRSEGEVKVFPDLKRKGIYRHGKKVSSWFNDRYRKKCGIKSISGRLKDFHSFRVTFITDLARKKVPDAMLSQTVGHSIGKTETVTTYLDDYKEKQIYDEIISKVDFHKQIDLSHLKNSKYVIK